MAEFNLIDKPWIPCIHPNGKKIEHGIRYTLLRAHQLREVCDDSPLVTVAIHRLLLAILYRAYEGPSDIRRWKELYSKPFALDSRLQTYLTKWHDRFFLFDEAHPFMQIAGLDLNEYKNNGEIKNDKTDGLMRLAREAPDKGGRILFDHRVGTERPRYEPNQITKMIVSAQSFSGTGVASGGKVGDKTIKPTACQFAPCVEGFILWIQGDSLFHTLMLNLIPRDHVANDKPAWEDDSVIDVAMKSWVNPVSFTGPAQRFAPLSRFIHIIDQQSMFFTNGLKTLGDSEDPMKAYSRSDDKKDYQALELRKDKAAWRDGHTLFSIGSPLRKPPACLNHIARLIREGALAKTTQPRTNVVGLATDQGKALLWRHERLPVPLSILGSDHLRERLGKLITEAEVIGSRLSSGLFWSRPNKKVIRKEPVGRIQEIAELVITPSLQSKSPGVLRTSEGRAPEEAHNKAALDLCNDLDPSPAYWARLEQHFFQLLENLPDDWDNERDDWKPDDEQIATRAFRDRMKSEAQQALQEGIKSLGTTARAIQAVARVRTNFNDDDLNPPPQTAGKTKKGKRKEERRNEP
jgi:CRISPR system Cascade subunit CasA